MRAILHDNGRLGRAGALRAPGPGRTAAVIAGILALLLGLLVIAIMTAPRDRLAAADDLTQQVLVGPRALTCQRVVVMLDHSGSMTDYARVRTDAMATLATWASDNLRHDDQLAVVRWADSAVIDTPPVEVGALAPSGFATSSSQVGGGTNLLPAVESLNDMASTACRTSLVFISDGEIGLVDKGRLDSVLQSAGVDAVGLVLPAATSAPSYWMQLFPYSRTFHAAPNDPNQTAVALGQAIAMATGQQLELAP